MAVLSHSMAVITHYACLTGALPGLYLSLLVVYPVDDVLQVDISSNYITNENMLEPGEYDVHYEGIKLNNNRITVCDFSITVIGKRIIEVKHMCILNWF